MAPKILLVDDNPAWVRLLPEILKSIGIKDVEIMAANSAEEGVRMFGLQKKSGARLNLVLMDLMLPGVSGDIATRSITEEDSTANVYGFTMFDDVKSVDMMKQAGVRGVISKQDSVDVIAKNLKAALDNGR